MALASAPATITPDPFSVRAAVPTRVRLQSTRRFDPRRMVVVAVLAVAASFGVAGVVGASAPEVVEHHTVHRGETLWSIARTRTAEGGDVRRTVAEIVEANGLSGAELSVGQVLVIPTR